MLKTHKKKNYDIIVFCKFTTSKSLYIIQTSKENRKASRIFSSKYIMNWRFFMSHATITLLFLLFAIIMFMWEKIPLGLTSMIVCVGLVVTGVLDWKTAFMGFIDSNVILFVAMFIVGGALFETGMANKIGGIVTHFAKSEKQLIIAIMVIVGLMSGVLSNTGTAAVLIPVVIGIAAKSGLVFAAAIIQGQDCLCHLFLQQLWVVIFHL